jgi:hypothetical protein
MSMLCAKAIRAKRSKSSNVPLLPSQVLEASLIKFKEAGEGWLRQREQKGSSPTLEEIRAKGREDWLKLRQQRTQQSPSTDRSAEKDQNAKPEDLFGTPGKGLDYDLN